MKHNGVIAVLVAVVCIVQCCYGSPFMTPPMGWSTWNTFKYDVSDSLLRQTSEAMISQGFLSAGYDYILIDDGWSLCTTHTSDGGCKVPAPRDSQNRIQIDPAKFPAGFNALTTYLHNKGFKVGIYTAMANITCGGFAASLYHESIDIQTFSQWGFDFVKLDTCHHDCSVVSGCQHASALRMHNAIEKYSPSMFFYIDAGNPSSGQRLYNPFQHHVQSRTMTKVARTWQQLVYVWANNTANMWKTWFDRQDNWMSLMDNVHHQVGLEWYQSRGGWNTPDMITTGQGALSSGQERVEIFIYAVLGAPLLMGADVRSVRKESKELLLKKEVIRIDQDEDCVQGSLVRSLGSGEIWARPLSNGDFAAALVNKDGLHETNVTIFLKDDGWCDTGRGDEKGSCNDGDLYPANFENGTKFKIRDAFLERDLGVFENQFTVTLPPMDAILIRITPLTK